MTNIEEKDLQRMGCSTNNECKNVLIMIREKQYRNDTRANKEGSNEQRKFKLTEENRNGSYRQRQH